MNSFKKVSLVIAAALAGTMLAVPSANANLSIAVTVDNVADNDANTLLGAASVTVPADNKVEAADAVKFVVSGLANNTVVTAVASNALLVPALHTTEAPVTASSGTTTYSINTGTGETATFFAFTKSTAGSTVTITNGGNSSTFYLKGTAGDKYNLESSVAASAATSSVVEYSVKVTDVFGNVVAGVTPTVALVNSTISVGATPSDATTGISKVSVAYPATSGQAGIGFSISATDIVGLPAAKKSIVAFISVVDLATALADAKAALDLEKAARAADKVAADKAAADAKALNDAAALKAAAELATANAEIAKMKAEAVTAKAAADKALADAIAKATADAATAKAASDKALADIKAAFNKLARSWNKKNPTAKVALLK